MQLRKKSDSPLDALINDSTNSPPASPALDSPSAQEDSKDVLPTNGEIVPLVPEFIPDAPKNQSKFGFLGWLTIFLVLSILGAIALPSFTGGCVNKAKQAEAKNNVATMNRSQQAYYLENKAFSHSIESLGTGISTHTTNYEYSTRATKTAAFSYGISQKGKKELNSYVGGVFLVPATNLEPKSDKDEITTVSIVCQATSPGNTRPANPILEKGVPTCGFDTKNLQQESGVRIQK